MQDFDSWYAAVCKAVERIAGCSADDLPDCAYVDWYEDGVSAVNAARRAIKAAIE